MVIQWQTGAAQVAGPTPDRDFVVSVVEAPTTDGGTTSTLVTNDVTWDTQITAASDNNFKIETPGATFESETPAVASVDASGSVTRVADGQCNILIRVAGQGARRYSRQMTRTGSTTVKTGVSSLASGSLLKYLTEQRDAILAASTPNASNQRAYVNADGTGGQNAANMLLRSDVAGFTPLNLSPILWNAYRWITPKHRIFTYHTNPYWGDGSAVVQSGSQYGIKLFGDTGIVYDANANVAAGNICKLLPSNWRSYLPTFADLLLDVPIWSRRRWVGSTSSGELYWIQAASDRSSGALLPVGATAATFAHPTNGSMGVGGDSGSPAFMGINGEAVLVGHVSWSGGRFDTEYGDRIAEINTALVTTATAAGDPQAGTYAATTVNLSGFNAY